MSPADEVCGHAAKPRSLVLIASDNILKKIFPNVKHFIHQPSKLADIKQQITVDKTEYSCSSGN
jgi:hypothetical protein